MGESSQHSETVSLAALEGKYLTFGLASESYGLQILKVQEIIGMMRITAVPRTERYLKGVINLRGKIIPVVDLRLKFGLEEVPPSERTCMIVVQAEVGGKGVLVALIIDTVQEVLTLTQSQLEPAPEYGTTLSDSFILALGRTTENKVVILVDINKALSDISPIASDAHAAAASSH